MKKVIIAILLNSILLNTPLTPLHAQTIIAGISNAAFTTAMDKTESREAINEEVVNVKAIKNFEKSFKKVEHVKWYKTNDGFMVYFFQRGTKKVSGYSPAGNWIYDLVSYPGEKLSSEISNRVKSIYYSFSITWVNEVETGSKTIYVVHIEDKNGYKNIRVCDDEMDEIEQISKI